MKTARIRLLLAKLLCVLLLATPCATRAADTFISFTDLWFYRDFGVDQGTAWREPSYDDTQWSIGITQFGFGEGDEYFELNAAPNGSPLNTAYFRTWFNIGDVGIYSNLTVRMVRDDGAIVYINGVEVFRSNMPTGAVTYATQAQSSIDGANEFLLAQRVVPAGVLVNGRNVIAVEVHQAEGGSDDMSFDLQLIAHRVGENQPPSAYSSSVSVDQNKSTNITLNATDPDNNPLTYTLLSSPQHGTLSGVEPNLTYTPDPTYAGPDMFSFKASDGQWETEIADVCIEVKVPSNHPPVADAQNVTVAEDNSLSITLSASDADGDVLTYSYSQPSHGVLAPGPGHTVVYQPAVNYNGPDAFAFSVDDGNGGTASTTVNITVTPVNDAPLADAQSLRTDEDMSLAITLTASDVEGNTLSFSHAQPAHGTVTGTGNHLSYAPAPNFNGNDSFLFNVNDGNGGVTTATIQINVLPVNDAPTANGQNVVAAEDTAVGISLGAGDLDGDALAYSYTSPAHGAVTGTGSEVVYQAAPNFNGTDSFTFTVNDGKGGTATATVNITVNPVNDAPAAGPQTLTVAEDTATTVTFAASDVDGDALIYSYTQPAHGTVTGTGNTAIYLAAANYNGPDAFTFTVNDGKGGTATAAVNITVTPVNDAPVALAWVAPAFDPTALTRNLTLISANNQDALVFLKGSASSDIDSSLLSYAWYREGSKTPLSTSKDATIALPLGGHVITLVVSDGIATASDTVTVQIFSACNRVQALASKVKAAALRSTERNTLLNQLSAACSAFDSGDFNGGVHHLELFQDRVNKKVAPDDPVTAKELNNGAQQIIDQVSGLQRSVSPATRKKTLRTR
jgi:hypothetical protein